MLSRFRSQRGFTFPELLLVVVIFGAFATGATILVHPLEFDTIRRDAERWTGAAQLTQALGRYAKDRGTLPKGLNSGEAELIGRDEGMVDLCAELTPKYLDKLPIDPTVPAEVNADCKSKGTMITGYAVQKISDHAFEVTAPLSNGEAVSLRRQF